MIMITTFLSFLALFTIILGAMGLDFITAISGAASAISNVGPGLGDIIGPDGNYKNIVRFSLFLSVVFEMITPCILNFFINSIILLISLSDISGETLSVNGF